MAASIRSTIRTNLRNKTYDTNAAAYVFTDAEWNAYLDNAIRAYSQIIPRQVKGTLSLVAAQYEDYTLPEDCRGIVSIMVGTTEYTVTEVFAGLFSITPAPGASATAVFKYLCVHTLPAADGSASTYDPIDEPLIEMHMLAQACETLSFDGAKYYQYTEGDVAENQGKTQEQFRAEADALLKEFAKRTEASKAQKDEIASVAATGATSTIAAVISRAEHPTRSTTIYREFE
jgi:hypothetical protein